MANILKAITEGTSETVGGAVKTTAKRAMSNVPNPAEAVYNLGLGIGPLLRSIADKAKSKDKQPATEKQQKAAAQQDTKHINKMVAQLTLSNSLLKEIRGLHIKQIAALNKQGTVSGGLKGRGLVPRRERDIQGGSVSAASQMLQGPRGQDQKEEGMGFGTKLAYGAVGLFALSKLMNQDLKDALGNLAGGLYKELKPVLVDGISNVISNAWNTEPVYTAIAGLFIAHVTGVLGFATKMAQAAIGTYNLSEKAASKYKTEPVTGQPSPTSIQPKAAKVDPNLAKAQAEYNRLINSADAADRYQAAQKAAAKFGVADVESVRQAPTEPVAQTKPTTTAMGRASSFIRGAGWFGTALTLGQGAAEYWNASEAEKKGEIDRKEAAQRKGGAVGSTGGALAGGVAGGITGGNIGMALGGAIGALFGGVGAVPGAAIGRVLGTLAGGYFGSKAGGEGGQIIGSAVGGINADTGRVNAQSTPEAMGDSSFDLARYRDLVGQHESTNNYAADNHVGFLGRYQFGAAALEQFGLLKPGASKGRDRGAQSAVYDPSAWAPGYSLEGFLGSPALQDKVMELYTSAHYNALVKAGVIKSDMSGEDIASRLYTAHAGGVGGAVDYFKNGKSRRDFHFGEAASTASAASKMKGAWSSNMATTPAHSTPSGITPSALSSTSATAGVAFADTQKTLDSLVKVLGGENQAPININQIVTQALRDHGQGGGGAPQPRRNTPNGGNAAQRNAEHATPAGF